MRKKFNLKLFAITCCLGLFSSCTEEKINTDQSEGERITTEEQYNANILPEHLWKFSITGTRRYQTTCLN